MARARQFDTEVVLDQAMDAFWRHGYEATSVAHLLEVTGLQKGSLYQAFGDKHQLFLTVLDRYVERGEAMARETFATVPAGEAIEVWLGQLMAECSIDDAAKGCFLWNSISELAPHDAAVKDRTEAHVARMRDLLADVLARGQAERAYRRDLEPVALATYLMTVLAGAVHLRKGNFAATDLQSLPALVLDTLRGPTDPASPAPGSRSPRS